MNPRGGLPCEIRASFTIVKIAPTTGEAADVPYTSEKEPSIATA